MQQSTRHIKAQILASLLAGSCLSGQAFAAIVHSGPVDIPIPDNLDGIYMNVVTGATGTSAGAVAGWDINPYSATGPGTHFNLWGATTTTWLSTGGVIAGPYNLAPGTEIGPPVENYFRPGGGTNLAAQMNLSSDENLLGFRFTNENTGQIHYGWVRVAFGATIGVRSIVEYAYEDEIGQPIAAGDTGEPLPDPIFADGFEE
ncbi:MAG TPA: hypothetical protein PKZ76_03855 [Xanthomonadaceae bacterium]|nr:hypothetical protein [Xanthomonadaceae bacterium]